MTLLGYLFGVPALKLDDPDRLLADAHPKVREEVLQAARKAVATGAASDLQYLGVGAEGILFLSRGRVFKVGRRNNLRNEAELLAALYHSPDRGFVPGVLRYNKELDVLVREYVEGDRGTWGSGTSLRKAYDVLCARAKSLDFTCPEFKEDSFIVRPSGYVVMVDLGFTQPVRARAAERLREQFDEPLPKDADLFSLQLDISQTTGEGFLNFSEGMAMFERLRETFGKAAVDPYEREYVYSYSKPR
jgi:hypothetical protein